MIHPEPEIACRPAAPDEIPRTAAKLAVVAEAAGWAVAVTYARGTWLGEDGEPARATVRVPLVDTETGLAAMTPTGKQRVEVVPTGEHVVRDSVAVRLRRDRHRLVGLWLDGKFWVGLRPNPLARLTSPQLLALVGEAA